MGRRSSHEPDPPPSGALLGYIIPIQIGNLSSAQSPDQLPQVHMTVTAGTGRLPNLRWDHLSGYGSCDGIMKLIVARNIPSGVLPDARFVQRLGQ